MMAMVRPVTTAGAAAVGGSAASAGESAGHAGAESSSAVVDAGATTASYAGAGGIAADGGGGAAGTGTGTGGGDAAPATMKAHRALSADFLNQTLSIIDVDKLKEGAKRSDALIGTVDLSKYTPGPLAIAVTPDGKTALVSISGGWLRLVAQDIPAGDGTLVFVDLDSRTVTGELDTGANPMGIVIAKDGKHAYVGQMSDTYMAYVDIEAKSFVPIQTGNQWNEELAIDDTGEIGMLTTGTAGDALSFSAADGGKTHAQTLGQTGDAGGVAFFPGTKSAFVVQAPTQLTSNLGGYNVIDASMPGAPVVTDTQRVPNDSRIAYPVTAVKGRKSVVYPSTDAGKLSLLEMGLEDGKAKLMQTIVVGDASTLAYGLCASDDGIVLVANEQEHYVGVADLNTGKVFTVPWEVEKTGPNDIKLIPSP
jgi:DNA-binding beta-propeller fold protein YncE